MSIEQALALVLEKGEVDYINQAFDRITWADNQIRDYMARYPDRACYLFDAFKLATPDPSAHVWDKLPLWRAHFIQLLDRITEDKPIEPATDAEILIAFAEISLKAPMMNDPTFVYWKLFSRIYGDKVAEWGLSEDFARESYDGASWRIYTEMQDKLKRKRPKPDPKRYQKMLEIHHRDLTIESWMTEVVVLMQSKPKPLYEHGDRVKYNGEWGTVKKFEAGIIEIMLDSRRYIQTMPAFLDSPAGETLKAPEIKTVQEAPHTVQLSFF